MSGGAAATAEAGAEGAEGEKKKGKGKLIILLAIPLVLVGAGAGLWFSGILPGMLGMGAKPEEAAASEPPPIVPALFEMPEIIVNLNVGNRRASYLKLTHRLREELIARANVATRPARVTDVLFVEMLVQ